MSLSEYAYLRQFMAGRQARARGIRLADAPQRFGPEAEAWKAGWHVTNEAIEADEPFCRSCGCTDESTCPGGCVWVDPGSMTGDLCSACARAPINPADFCRSE